MFCRWRRQLSYVIPPFDTDAMLIEVGLMPEWYLPDRGAALSDDLRAEFVSDVARAAGASPLARRGPGCCATFIRRI